MRDPDIKDIIRKIIKSDSFKIKLDEIDKHFYHLKQELHIRDALVKELNTRLNSFPLRAFAERPKETTGKTTLRRDVGVFEVQEHLPVGASIFNIELKYHYYRDLFNKNFEIHAKGNKDIQSLNNDWSRVLAGQRADLFLLVLCRRKWKFDKNDTMIAASDREFPIQSPDLPNVGAITALAKEISKGQSEKTEFDIDWPITIPNKSDGRETGYRFLGLYRS